jgi:RNA polymerase sigma-70 factor, ECF subfamily
MANAIRCARLGTAAPDTELRALLRRVADGDRHAFRSLYHALRPALVRHLKRLLRQSGQIDEVLNDVMWVVWQKAASFRGDAQVTTWVLGIATMKSRRVWQRAQRDPLQLDAVELSDEGVVVPAHGVDRDLHAALAQLSAEHREALELVYYFGYSCNEVATMRDCPVGTVKTRLFHARRRLKALLGTFIGEGEVT